MLIKAKFRIPDVFLGVLLAVSIFAVGAIFGSTRHQPPDPAPNNQIEHIDAGHNPQPFTVEWFTHDPVGFFSAALTFIAGIQAVLFVWQLSYMRKGMVDARLVAAATEKNTRAAIALQLPHIRIEPQPLSLGVAITGGVQTERCAVPFIDIINQGSTRAFPREVLYGWTVGNELPKTPAYQFADRFPLNIFIAPNSIDLETPAPMRRFLPFDCRLEAGEREKILRGNFLRFYCDLIYDDFMGETHHWGYCWRWTNVGIGLGWRADDTPAYNRKT